MRIWIALAALLGATRSGSAGGLNPLEIQAPDARGWPRLSIATAANRVVRLDTSDGLFHWREVGRSHDGLEDFPDPLAALGTARFCRAVHVLRSAADDWRKPDAHKSALTPGSARL